MAIALCDTIDRLEEEEDHLEIFVMARIRGASLLPEYLQHKQRQVGPFRITDEKHLPPRDCCLV